MDCPLTLPNTPASITPAVKTEVKIEHEEPPKPLFPSSTPSLKTSLPFPQSPQSTFKRDPFPNPPTNFLSSLKFSPTMGLFSPTNNPMTTLSQLNLMMNIFSLLSPLVSPLPTPQMKIPEKKPTPAPSASKTQADMVKKEEHIEESKKTAPKEPLDTDAEKAELNAKKTPKKKAQNRIKNIPGLIMQRVRSSIKAYFTRSPRFEKNDKRLAYVEKTVGNLSKEDKERLLAYLDEYQKNWKTWNTIQRYLQSNLKFGEIMLDVVMEFFKEDGLMDFDGWLTSGKMGEKSRAAVNEMKDRIGVKFSKLLMNTEREEEAEEIACPTKDKVVKKEELD